MGESNINWLEEFKKNKFLAEFFLDTDPQVQQAAAQVLAGAQGSYEKICAGLKQLGDEETMTPELFTSAIEQHARNFRGQLADQKLATLQQHLTNQ
ncbi:MAG: hypothetical protein DHS20C02_02240 [Micavibrio sp.]|nr:MAG: hypothetical protein DHS20C02_02240 [Micavibrio sp.]